MQVWSLGWEDSLQKGMASHSSILAWRIPMDRGAWWVTVHGVTKSRKRLSNFISVHQVRNFSNYTSLARGASGKEPACQCRRHKRCRFDPWVRKISWRRAWQSTPVFLPGETYGQRSLARYRRSLLYSSSVYYCHLFFTQKLWAIKPRLWPQIELFYSRGQESWRLSWLSNNLSVPNHSEWMVNFLNSCMSKNIIICPHKQKSLSGYWIPGRKLFFP